MAVMTIAQDTAVRANQSGWGTASDGETWTHPIGAGTLSISGNELSDTNTTTTGGDNMLLGGGKIINGDLTVRFSLSNIGGDIAGFTVRYVDNNNYVRVQITSGHITIRVVVAGIGTNLTPTTGITLSNSTYYRAHLNLNNNVYSMNVWLDGNSEPGGWVCQATDSANNFVQPTQYGIFASIGTINDVVNHDSFVVTSTPPIVYISPTGNDSTGDGSLGNPYLTVTKADTVIGSGSIVNILPGIYTYAATANILTNGTPLARVVWQATGAYGSAQFVGTMNNSSLLVFQGNYTDTIGLNVSGALVRTAHTVWGNHCRIWHCSANDCGGALPSGSPGAGFYDYAIGGASSNEYGWCTAIRCGMIPTSAAEYHGFYLSGNSVTVHDCISSNNSAYGFVLSGVNFGRVAHNTAFFNSYAGFALSGAAGTADNNIFANNISYNNNVPASGVSGNGYIIVNSPGGVHNVWTNNCSYLQGTQDYAVISSPGGVIPSTNALHADPQFVNYRTDGAGDYHLLSTSPCRGAGILVSIPGAPYALRPLGSTLLLGTQTLTFPTDFDGNARPQGTSYDIGPYEYVPNAIVPPRIFIGGSPVFVEAGSLNFGASIGKNSGASFNVQSDNNTHFQENQQVRIVDQTSTLVFTGYVTTPKEQKPGFQSTLEHAITCTNQHRLAEKRLVAASYTNKSAGYMVNDIYNNILSSEGVTIGLIYDAASLAILAPSTSLAPSLTLAPTDNVGIVPEATFVYCTVAQAFDALVTAANASGTPYYWMIDQNKALWFAPYTAVVNPTVIDGSQIDQVRHQPTVTRSNPTYRNTQYLIGGVAQTVSQTETRKGDGNTVSFPMSYDLASVPTITVNAVAKAVGIRGVDTGKDWYWQKGSPDISQDSGGTKLVSTDTLSVTYIGQFPTVIVDRNNAQVSFEQGLDGTTGIVEEVETDTTISFVSSGLAKTSALLTRYAAQGTILEFMTKQTGYAPGQLVTVNLPDHQLYNVQMLIEDVQASDQIDGFNIWYTIKAVSGPYDQSWVDFFKVLFKSTAQANSINVGVSQSVVISVTGSVNLAPSVTGSATVYSCPMPSLTLAPSTSLFPC